MPRRIKRGLRCARSRAKSAFSGHAELRRARGDLAWRLSSVIEDDLVQVHNCDVGNDLEHKKSGTGEAALTCAKFLSVELTPEDAKPIVRSTTSACADALKSGKTPRLQVSRAVTDEEG